MKFFRHVVQKRTSLLFRTMTPDSQALLAPTLISASPGLNLGRASRNDSGVKYLIFRSSLVSNPDWAGAGNDGIGFIAMLKMSSDLGREIKDSDSIAGCDKTSESKKMNTAYLMVRQTRFTAAPPQPTRSEEHT